MRPVSKRRFLSDADYALKKFNFGTCVEYPSSRAGGVSNAFADIKGCSLSAFLFCDYEDVLVLEMTMKSLVLIVEWEKLLSRSRLFCLMYLPSLVGTYLS